MPKTKEGVAAWAVKELVLAAVAAEEWELGEAVEEEEPWSSAVAEEAVSYTKLESESTIITD